MSYGPMTSHAADCAKRAAHLIRKAVTMLELADCPILAQRLKPFAKEAEAQGKAK